MPNKGDKNPDTEKWMSDCVSKVMKSGKDKGSAIAICKTTFKKMHENKEKAEFIIDQIITKII